MSIIFAKTKARVPHAFPNMAPSERVINGEKVKIQKYLRLLSFASLLMTGCGTYYLPGIAGTQVPAVISLPLKENASGARAKYISLDGGKAWHFNDGESNRAFRGLYLAVHSGKHSTVNYGGFVYGGSYSVAANKVQEYRGDHPYFGPGLECSGEIHFTVHPADIGIGFSTIWGMELGDFAAFRRRAAREGLADCSTNPFFGMLSVYPLFRFRPAENTSISVQYALGLPGILSPTVSVQHGDYAFWICPSPQYYDEPGRDMLISMGIGHRIP
jgi:hypothetical protein